MRQPRVLLIGHNNEFLRFLPFLFFRAGFAVEMITPTLLPKNKFVSRLNLTPTFASILNFLPQKNLGDYALIVVCDDETLKLIKESELEISQKMRLLPITAESALRHICSKSGLSEILREARINTPNFAIVNGITEALRKAEKLKFPLMVKRNGFNGGFGVFECRNLTQLELLPAEIFASTLLLQEKISGTEIDLSGLYLDEKLVWFSYSEIKGTTSKRGPSCLRLYHQLARVDEKVFKQMADLGRVLKANGFVTISAIKSNRDGKIYFFECDMRPNAWADHGRFFGDDLATRISDYFYCEKTLQRPKMLNPKYPTKIVVPLFCRTSLLKILFNRHNVWRFFSAHDIAALVLAVKQEIPAQKIRLLARKINRIPTLTIRFFLPQKEVRKKIKFVAKKILGFA